LTYGYWLPMLLASSSSVVFHLRPFARDQAAQSVGVCGARRRPCLIRGPRGLAAWLDLGCVAQPIGWSAAPRSRGFLPSLSGVTQLTYGLPPGILMHLASSRSTFVMFHLRRSVRDQAAPSVRGCGARRRPCLIRGPRGLAVRLDLGCVAQPNGWSAAPRPWDVLPSFF